MKTFKIFANLAFATLAVAGLVISLFTLYYYFFNKDITIGTNYITTVQTGEVINEEELTDEEIEEYNEAYFMELNYFSNDLENGIELQELKLNFASDFQLSDYFATGMQHIGDYEHTEQKFASKHNVDTYVWPDFNYYNGYDNIDWQSTMLLNRKSNLPISIDDEAYTITLDKIDFKKILIFEYNKTAYTWPSLFAEMFDAVKSNSASYGDWYIKFDLSKYFTVKKYNEETKKFENDDLSDQVFNYVLVKVHYEENGAVAASQSLFNIIDNNPTYGEDETIDSSYWQERIVYNLTEEQLNLRYSETFEGYFASLPLSTQALIEDNDRVTVNVIIDMNNTNIVGFDYSAFKDFEIDTITIKSSTSKTFYMLKNSLIDTNLKTILKTSLVSIDYAEDSTNNEFVEEQLTTGGSNWRGL